MLINVLYWIWMHFDQMCSNEFECIWLERMLLVESQTSQSNSLYGQRHSKSQLCYNSEITQLNSILYNSRKTLQLIISQYNLRLSQVTQPNLIWYNPLRLVSLFSDIGAYPRLMIYKIDVELTSLLSKFNHLLQPYNVVW